MANALYDKGREAFLKGQINWIDDTIKVALVKTPSTPNSTPAADEYKVNLATDQFLSSVPTSSILITKNLDRSELDNHAKDGVADGADVLFENVTGKIGAVIIYKLSPSGDRESSRLIAYLDQLNGIPHNPMGGNVQIKWDNGINKIFKL